MEPRPSKVNVLLVFKESTIYFNPFDSMLFPPMMYYNKIPIYNWHSELLLANMSPMYLAPSSLMLLLPNVKHLKVNVY